MPDNGEQDITDNTQQLITDINCSHHH